ncbi:hypothetical protein [Streptomyces sp. WAC06614]|uniref:hypothetical protein n=1 Tax=Streptomyces sp. WAC06614 TaxID=2487416 RepID=UPI000F9DC6F5|nr:hypothetical protein [Streptomyces sp. WAC06614]RSS61443.1 hypothetical protein EF918_31835 [Streptomyces sp. WAC06614]
MATPDAAPEALLRAALREPGRLPELLAGFALRHAGPRAARSVARLRAERPGADTAALGAELVERGVRRTVTEGAFVGGPFLVFIPVAFCAALLSQARTMLELAALAGHDPTEPRRAAELMVLQGVYADPDTAQRALAARSGEHRRAGETGGDGPGRSSRRKNGGRKGRRSGRFAVLTGLTLRMAKLLGLMPPRPADTAMTARDRLAMAGRWTLLAVTLLVGMVAPLVWLPYMAVSYRRSTRQALSRAAAYYLTDTPLPSPRSGTSRLDPGMLAAAARAVSFAVLPLLLVVVVHVADLGEEGNAWPVAGMVVVASAVLAGALWHYWRHRRRLHRRDPD